MSFSRTDSGLAAEHLFRQKILVYVEGHTDRAFYEEVLQNYNCQVIPKHGREECERLATILVQDNHPYVVILDGDYEILERTRSQHRRIILLHRHSFENYLFEEEPIEQFCWDRTDLEDSLEKLPSRFQKVVEDTELKFKELIVLDVAHQRSNTGYDVLPNKPDRFLKSGKSVAFRDNQIEQYVQAAQCIDRQSIDDAKALVEQFLRKRRFIDLLPGHFAFGIMRRLIINTVDETVSNDEIRLYFSRIVWKLVKTPDHDSLKRRLRRGVREGQKIPKSGKGIRR